MHHSTLCIFLRGFFLSSYVLFGDGGGDDGLCVTGDGWDFLRFIPLCGDGDVVLELSQQTCTFLRSLRVI